MVSRCITSFFEFCLCSYSKSWAHVQLFEGAIEGAEVQNCSTGCGKYLLSVVVISAFVDGLFVYTLTGLTSKSRESYANTGVLPLRRHWHGMWRHVKGRCGGIGTGNDGRPWLAWTWHWTSTGRRRSHMRRESWCWVRRGGPRQWHGWGAKISPVSSRISTSALLWSSTKPTFCSSLLHFVV